MWHVALQFEGVAGAQVAGLAADGEPQVAATSSALNANGCVCVSSTTFGSQCRSVTSSKPCVRASASKSLKLAVFIHAPVSPA